MLTFVCNSVRYLLIIIITINDIDNSFVYLFALTTVVVGVCYLLRIWNREKAIKNTIFQTRLGLEVWCYRFKVIDKSSPVNNYLSLLLQAKQANILINK